jgi:hypothetical protein
MIECAQMCKDLDVSCPNKTCRQWMDYEDDLNCVRIASHRHGDMTLSQVAERLGLTAARIQQIEKGALAKLKKLM